MSEKIKVLLSEEEVDSRIKQIAAKVSKDYEVQDGVLHFFVNYNLTLSRPFEETPMETLDVDVEPKKG